MCAIESTFYKDYGMTTEQWNAIGAECQEICKKNPKAVISVMKLIEGGMKPEDLAKSLAGSAETRKATGTEVEKQNQTSLDALKPKVVLEDMENKDMRKVSEEQWKEYFIARYEANPAEAERDIARIVYRKEVAQVQAGLQNMLNDAKQSKVVKAKYFAEGFASDKEQKAYEDKMKELQAYYKENKAEAIRDYNGLFRVVGYNDPVDEGGHLTSEQLDALIRLKGLDSVEIDGDRLSDMAVTAVVNNRFNKGVTKANEYMAKVEELKAENITPEIRKIQQDAIEQDSRYDQECAKLMQEAQTEESIKLFNEHIKNNKELEAEIAKQKRLGNTEKAEELEKKRLEDRAEAQKKIHEAMDQDKLKQAEELSKKRYDARLAAEKAAYDALDPKVKAKIEELEKKAADAVKDANTSSNNDVRDKIPDIAAIMAESQVDKQRAEARFNRTTVHWGDGKDSDDGKTRNVYLDDEMRQFVKDNPELFCDEVEEGADFSGEKRNPETGEKTTVGYKFNEQKFQDYMLRLANDNQLDNEDADDPSNKADYYATIKERKELNDAKNYSYATPAKLKDRRFAKKCYEAAGLDLEKDKTVAKRWGNLAKKTIIGAGVGGGVALLSEYISTTKVVSSPFFKVVEYAGSVPYMQMVHVKGTTDATLKGRYQDTIHVEGYEDYHQDILVEGVAEGEVTLGYSGSGTAHYTHPYSGSGVASGIVSGTATGNYSGTASGSVPVEHTHTDWQNGRPIGQKTWTDNVDVNIPYSGQVSIPYEQGVTLPYEYSGVAEGDVGYTYSGTTTGKGQIPYKQVVSANGTVRWEADVDIDEEVTVNGKVDYETDVKVEGEAEYKGQKEINETVTGRPKMDWGNIGKATIIGSIGGAAKGLMDWNHIYDEGGRDEGIARQVLSEKGVDAKKKPTSTPPKPPEQSSTIKIDSEKTPDQERLNAETKTVAIPVAAPEKRGNKVYYQGWQTLQKAYGAPNSANFRNWFRKNYLGGKDIWETGSKNDGAKIQHFEREIEYVDPKTKKVYKLTFNPEIFAKALDFYEINNNTGTAPTVGNTKPNVKVSVTKIPGTETYKGSITVKIGDKTYTASTQGHTSEKAVKDALKTELLKQGLSDSEVDKAIREAVPQN